MTHEGRKPKPCGEIAGGLPALVPPRDYQVSLRYWTTYKLFGRAPKLSLWFQVLDSPFLEVILPRHYNVKELIGRAGRDGRFKAAPNSDFVREYAEIANLPRRFDRIDLDALKGVVLLGSVGTVDTSARQKVLPAATHYSVIRSLRLA